MPVNYRIGGIDITNFRGIDRLAIDFEPGVVTYLIGANNAGKSTVLNAIAIALAGGGHYNFSPGEYDFFHGSAGGIASEFQIKLNFSADQETELPAVQGVGAPFPVHGVLFQGRRDEDGATESQHVLVGDDGKPIAYPSRTPLKGELKEAYRGHGNVGFARQYARLVNVREAVPEVWLLRPDNLNASLYRWQTGPLARLASLLSKRFLDEEWSFTFGGKARQMPQQLDALHKFFRTAVTEFPFWKDDLKPKLEETLSRYVGRDASMGLYPTIQAIEDWLKQQLVVSFAADGGTSLTPLQQMGDGWQSLVRIASLDVLRQFPAEMKDRVVLLFEEPETYLHPHLRRKLRGVMADLAKLGWTVVCSTHAPEFLSFSESQMIVRLWRPGGSVTKGVLSTTAIPDGPRFDEKIGQTGNHEMLFAHRVVLCEGKDDEFAIRVFLEKADVDLNGECQCARRRECRESSRLRPNRAVFAHPVVRGHGRGQGERTGELGNRESAR